MDAGTQVTDHYEKHLEPWRFKMRSNISDIVRLETAVLAKIQQSLRTPLSDTYFALSANIGTHTFYMVMLPVFFWYGNYLMGIDVIMVSALGVFTTGFVKDLSCLPRPRSPPLHRISMSASAKLEYGLPSTHSCNAISVALLFHRFDPNNKTLLRLSIWMVVTLILGRIYTGMHGFLDIIVGCLFGVLSFWACVGIMNVFDSTSSFHNGLLTAFFVAAISLSPSPVDDCPCFDDSVAFSGVVMGMMWGICFLGVPQPFKFDGTRYWHSFLTAIARYIVGVLLIVTWRDISKRILLRVSPPTWRALDRLGLRNPRRFFIRTTANEHITTSEVPDETFHTTAKEFVHHLRHSPEDTVGPQSEADLYEIRSRQSKSENQQRPNPGQIQHMRQHYDFEVFMRLLIYGGIGPVTLWIAPTVFKCLNI